MKHTSLTDMGFQFIRHAKLPKQSRTAALDRLAEEVKEAREADPDALGEELADIVLCVASMAASFGFNLDDAIERKHRKNLTRTWRPHPTIPGALQHGPKPRK